MLVEGGPTLAASIPCARARRSVGVAIIAPVVLGAGPGWPQASHELEGERVPVRPFRADAMRGDRPRRAARVRRGVLRRHVAATHDRVGGGVRCSPGSFGRSAASRRSPGARRSRASRCRGAASPRRTLAVGDSLAVNGICLTVTRRAVATVEVEATEETRRVTTLGRWTAGDRVHLEPALRAGDSDRRPLRPRPRGRRRAGGTIRAARTRRRVARGRPAGAGRATPAQRVDRRGRRQPDARRGAFSRARSRSRSCPTRSRRQTSGDSVPETR